MLDFSTREQYAQRDVMMSLYKQIYTQHYEAYMSIIDKHYTNKSNMEKDAEIMESYTSFLTTKEGSQEWKENKKIEVRL
jgi:hypothetical protein